MSVHEKILINGLFYSQKTTGVHRFARELLNELDRIASYGIIILAIPKYTKVPQFKNIITVEVGSHQGLLWEQWDYAIYARKGRFLTVSLCNSQPLLAPGVLAIHDVAYKTHPEYFKTFHGRLSVMWHKIVYRQTANFTKFPILTVSYFSKYSIIDTYHVNPNRISVVGNGWQHLKRIINNNKNILKKYSLQKNDYYFTLGNVNYNKNTQWVIEYAQKHPKEMFVLSGVKVKNSKINVDNIPNVRYLGYIEDCEIAVLYANCKAFIFPSIHEGFGIPPMEALYYGAKVIVANTTCLPEIYQSSVYYIDAYSTDLDLEELMKCPVSSAQLVLQRYSWENSAKIANTILMKYIQKTK